MAGVSRHVALLGCVVAVLTACLVGAAAEAPLGATGEGHRLAPSTWHPKQFHRASSSPRHHGATPHDSLSKPALLPMDSFSPAQIRTFLKYGSAATVYFEFGAGGSTSFMMHKTAVPEVHSVDSSMQWLQNIMHPAWQGRLNTIHVDIGPLGNYGTPIDKSRKLNWPTYSAMIASHPEADVVLVDGRFRVACVCKTLLSTRPGTIIMIHDWRRKEYQVVREHVDMIEEVGILGVMRAKAGMDRAAVLEMWNNYKYLPQDR